MIWVTDVNHAGFVVGSDGFVECGGGGHMVWGDTGSGWEALFALQDVLPCDEFAAAGIPPGTSSLECYNDSGDTYF